MPDPLRCAPCGTEAIIPRVRVLDRGACGYAELYVEAPRALYAAYLQADASPTVSALEELDRTREALADSQLRLQELEEKLAFVEQLIEPRRRHSARPENG